MQDYASSGFAPAISESFALNPSKKFAPVRDLPIQSLLVAVQPTNRGEIIFQQERKIRNDFLSKTNIQSKGSKAAVIASGTVLQCGKAKAAGANSEFRFRLIASAVAVAIMLFAGQLGCSVLSKQLAASGACQSSSANPAAVAASLKGAIAHARSHATAAGVITEPSLSRDTFDQNRKIDDLIAMARAKVAANEQAQLKQNSSEAKAEVSAPDLSATSTVDLIKSGYEKLCAGSAKEAIAVLSEAVKRDRNDPTSRRYLGYALLQAGRPTEALHQYDALQKLDGLLQTDRLAMQHAESLVQTN